MQAIVHLILTLLLPLTSAFANSLSPNTGNLQLNSNINMHVVVDGDLGCLPGYLWHIIYGGCRMRGTDIAEHETDVCQPEEDWTGTRTRSRYREQWILQGSDNAALGSWGNWQAWDLSGCVRQPTDPPTAPNRAHLHAYSIDEGQGGGESLTPVLLYVHCTLYRNNALLIDRHVFINAVYYHRDSLRANQGEQACNRVVAEIQTWGISASIDYTSIDWNATMGWARVSYAESQ